MIEQLLVLIAILLFVEVLMFIVNLYVKGISDKNTQETYRRNVEVRNEEIKYLQENNLRYKKFNEELSLKLFSDGKLNRYMISPEGITVFDEKSFVKPYTLQIDDLKRMNETQADMIRKLQSEHSLHLKMIEELRSMTVNHVNTKN